MDRFWEPCKYRHFLVDFWQNIFFSKIVFGIFLKRTPNDCRKTSERSPNDSWTIPERPRTTPERLPNDSRTTPERPHRPGFSCKLLRRSINYRARQRLAWLSKNQAKLLPWEITLDWMSKFLNFQKSLNFRKTKTLNFQSFSPKTLKIQSFLGKNFEFSKFFGKNFENSKFWFFQNSKIFENLEITVISPMGNRNV